MHHGKELDAEMEKAARQLELGATNRSPEGKLDETDEGEIKLAVGHMDGKVLVNFGTPVVWFGLDPKQARALAESIRQHSYKAEGK